MFMTSSYELIARDGDVEWCEYLTEEEHCPVCGSVLLERDRRKRIARHFGGVTRHIIVRRMYCPECRRLHVELPDILLPHKHYEADVIESVYDGNVKADDDRAIEGPTKVAMKLWLAWLRSDADRISDLYVKSLQILKSRRTSQNTDRFHESAEFPAAFRLLMKLGRGWLSAGFSLIYGAGFLI